MRTLWRVAAIVFIISTSVFARGRVSGYCQQGGQVVVTGGVQSASRVQQSYPQCAISVLITGGARGSVNTSGTSVTWQSGTVFNANSGWVGLSITIAGMPYLISTVNSSTSITLSGGGAGSQTGVAYSMPPTAPAAIFSDNSGTPLANPFTSTQTGYWAYFADNGTYDVAASGGGIPVPFTWGSLPLIDPVSINPVISVSLFGAACRPGVDDTAAFQAAYNSLSGTPSRSVLSLPAGGVTCYATSIEQKGPAELDGHGGTIQQKAGDTSTAGLIYTGASSAIGLTIRNLTLLGNGGGTEDCVHIGNGAQTNDGFYNVATLFCKDGIYANELNDFTFQDVYSQDNTLRNLDVEASTDVNFVGTNVFQALTIQPTDNVLISGSTNIHGGGFQCEIVYATPCMKFVNSIADFTGLTGFWASASGTLSVPAAFVVANTASGRLRLSGMNTWVQNGTVALSALVSVTESTLFTGTLNFVGNGNSTATTGFNELLWGDYSFDGANAGAGYPFALPSSGLNIIGSKMASVSTSTGTPGGTAFSAQGDTGGQSTNVSGTGGGGGNIIAIAGTGGPAVTGGAGGVAEIRGGTAGAGSTTNGAGGAAFIAGGNAPAAGNSNGGEADIFGGTHVGSGTDGAVRIQQDFNSNVYTGPIYTNIGSAQGTLCPSGTHTSVFSNGSSGALFGNACEPSGGYTGSGASAIPACGAGNNAVNVHVSDGKAVGSGGTYAAADGSTYRNVHCINATGWEYF
jgi:hypothetical protein